jgi:hypothetical protein
MFKLQYDTSEVSMPMLAFLLMNLKTNKEQQHHKTQSKQRELRIQDKHQKPGWG